MATNLTAVPNLDPNSNLTRYLQEIRKFPLLEAEEEFMLAKNWAEHEDAEAAHKLVTSHLRLVAKIATGYRGYGLPLGELISEGNVGLMQAVKRFDPDRGFRLATYAMWWIRASIQEYILHTWSLVKIGTTAAQKKLFFNLRRLKGEIKAIEDGDLTPEHVEEIATKLKVSEADVVSMNRRMAGPDNSLNAPVRADSEGEFIHPRITAAEHPDRQQTDGAGDAGTIQLQLFQARRLQGAPSVHLNALDDFNQVIAAQSKTRDWARQRQGQQAVGPALKQRLDMVMPGGESAALGIGGGRSVGDVIDHPAEGVDGVHAFALGLRQQPHGAVEGRSRAAHQGSSESRRPLIRRRRPFKRGAQDALDDAGGFLAGREVDPLAEWVAAAQLDGQGLGEGDDDRRLAPHAAMADQGRQRARLGEQFIDAVETAIQHPAHFHRRPGRV